MSRTYKDEPYDVKARKLKGSKTKSTHNYACQNNLNSNEPRVGKVIAIFYGHEVTQMKAMDAKIEEIEATVKIRSVNGYLVHHHESDGDEPRNKSERKRRPFFGLYNKGRKRIVSEPEHPNFYAKNIPVEEFLNRHSIKRNPFGYSNEDLYATFTDYSYKVSEFNSFYIYEIEYNYPNPWISGSVNNNVNPEECCPPSLPGWLGGYGCNCKSCGGSDSRRDPESKVKEIFVKTRNAFNSCDHSSPDVEISLDDDDMFNSLKIN
jgi:hypothetical protein